MDNDCIHQIYIFKPVQQTISTVFLLLLIYSFGVAWAKCLPRRKWVLGTRLESLAPVIHFFNPGDFSIKEVSCPPHCLVTDAIHCVKHVIASLVASTAAYGSTAVVNFAVQRVR